MSDSILGLPAPSADRRIYYGTQPSQFVDVRVPQQTGLVPAAIVIHGGFWRDKYDLEHIGHVCAALTQCGIATWNIEYRRIGQAGGGWPGTFLDVAAAADALRDHAAALNIDLNRVVTIGHSAGGHLALWLAARRRLPANSPLWNQHPLPLRGAISLAGVADLQRAFELRLSQRVVAELMGGTPSEVPERYRDGSPAALLPLGVPQIALHGTDDGPVPFAISQDYIKQAQAAGDHAQLVTLHGAHHFELIDPRSAEWNAVQQAVFQLLDMAPTP